MSKSILSLLLIFNFVFATKSFPQSYKHDTTSTIYDLFFYSKKLSTLQDSVQILTKKINLIQTKINKNQEITNNLSNKTKLYKKIYIDILKFYYIFKLNYTKPIIFIFSNNEANKISENITFFKVLINFIHNIHKYLNLLNTELINNQKILNNYKQALTLLITKNNQNKNNIDSLVNYITQETKFLQQNNHKIRSYINREYKDFDRIERTIKRNMTFDTTNINLTLVYPLKNAKIISSFGVHNHPTLKNVKIKNDGIDLYSETDSIVKAASQGIVNSIIILPSKTMTILIKSGPYFTVYSYVKKPLVNVNDTVYINQPIAYVDNNYKKYNFPVINFQLWFNTTKLNPKQFISD